MTPSGDAPAADVADERARLFALAYRMLGSTVDAEDVVRQTYARWYSLSEVDRAEIQRADVERAEIERAEIEPAGSGEPRGWLTATAGRLCLTALATRQPIRLQYPGAWLPEPVPGLTLDESVTIGLLVTLDSLLPAERVAFVLHDVFGLTFASVGTIVGRSPASTRALAKSARRHIHERQPLDARPDPDAHRETVHALRLAAESGQPGILGPLLDPGARMLTDAGSTATGSTSAGTTGARAADPRTVTGRANVAAKICEVLRLDLAEISEQEVNGQSGLVLRRGARVIGIVSVNVCARLVTDLWIVLDPDKLRHWNR